MSIVGIFTRAQPSIGGRAFDAVIEESSELLTDVTEFPVETGAIGNDHALQRPLRITMTVGISDNVFRTIAANASFSPFDIPISGQVASMAIGSVAGAAIGMMGGALAAGIGMATGNAHAAYTAGQASTRSQSALDAIREIQRSNSIIDVVGTKKTYKNMMITRTYQQTTKENEQGLELVVEMQQLLIMDSAVTEKGPKKQTLSQNDSSGTQAQPLNDRGEVSLK